MWEKDRPEYSFSECAYSDDWERAAAIVVAAHNERSGVAELVEQTERCFDTIKHLSAMRGTDSGDSAVHGVALLGLQHLAAWKEAQRGR
jgi:hypothetical protein